MRSSRQARVAAIIPVRGGSKGIPGKNLREVGGVSLVERAVNAALATSTIDVVYVTTDDAAIAQTAVGAGAIVIDRPAELAHDTASSESALLHALDEIDRTVGAPEVTVFIQATSPFIRADDLDAAVTRVLRGDDDVVFSALETYAFLWKKTPAGAVGVNHDHSFRPRRQDREPHYQETGAFYVMRTTGFRAARFRFFGTVGIAEVDERDAIEIDTMDQLTLASLMSGLSGSSR
ncbi:cytidylyltransferase domain-containing protein [Glaciihabitans sp. dw_435]|uniref:acylneuraminate cytidylyltransferase family protein n=1 Tax=Glaciihabitans sp. dw_435 TaxID=2720081 RepID=UPI001BD2F9CE|nr:acylneuraminate cytidylyltransferase family protein [Glaciihabitans sp. dw_435]